MKEMVGRLVGGGLPPANLWAITGRIRVVEPRAPAIARVNVDKNTEGGGGYDSEEMGTRGWGVEAK